MEIDKLADDVFEAIEGYVRRSFESAAIMKFRGPHTVAQQYGPGDVVQRGGALFIAQISTAEIPGASAAWRRIAQDR